MNNSICKNIVHFGILIIICIVAFLIAKYIVRIDIRDGDIPIDTSVRL